jgi:hypothetical protein
MLHERSKENSMVKVVTKWITFTSDRLTALCAIAALTFLGAFYLYQAF